MVVAVFAVLAMQLAVDQVIDVTVVRDRDVFAADAVEMLARMAVVGEPGIARADITRA